MKKIILYVFGLLLLFSGIVSASVSQTLRYNFRAVAEPSVSGWEDVVHPSDDASLGEVVVTTGGWSLVTVTGGWSPIFGATAFPANGQTVSDLGAILSPFAEYHLHGSLLYGLPNYPDYNAEFFITGQYFSSFATDGVDAFDTGVLNSNWSTQTLYNPYGPPSANILLTGLNPTKVYSFKMAGSLEDSAGAFLTGTTVYAVGDTSNTVLIQTRGNTSHYATFAGISPNAQGEISLRAMSAWNPAGYIGMLGGIQVIESDAVDVPVIDFAADEFRIYQPQSSRNLAPNISVGGGASIVSYRWRQIQGPTQVSFTTPTSASTDVYDMTLPGVYIVELGVLADNGIEQRQRMRIVVDTGRWSQRLIPNGNPAANNGQDIQYLEYLPDDYTTTGCENKNYPIIIYLHGYGQNGRDTEMLKGEGLGYLVDAGLTNLQFTGSSGELEKFIAVVPQLSTLVGWDADDIDAVIAHVMSGTYRVDYNRIYIAGFSYGSLGLWNYLATPNKADSFAAAVPSAYVPTVWGAQYCNASGVSIFAMSEADMIQAGYYISSPADFTGFMNNLALCPVTPPVIGQVMTGRDHVEMYNFYWQTDYTGFEGKNIYQWFLDHERNYSSGGAGQACFTYEASMGLTISPSLQTIVSGDTANFTISIVNSGNVDLTGVVISSDTVPSCTITIDYIAQGASTGYSCSLTNVIASFAHNIVATGYAYTGGVTYTGYSTFANTNAQVNVASLAPNIEITKTPPSQDVVSGDTVGFTIVVTNTGNVDLTGIVVTDPLVPSCTSTIGFLAQGASTSYPCTSAPVYATFSPTTYVSGYAYTGGVEFPSYASQASVVSTVNLVPYLPVLDISINPTTQNLSAGGNAIFTVTVINTGDIDLTGVVVASPFGAACDYYIGYLPVGGLAGYGCQINGVTGSFIPTMTTTGYAVSGAVEYPTLTTIDIASATVTVSAPPPPPITGSGGGGGGGYGSFAGGGMSTYNPSATTPQSLSTIPQTTSQTTLSELATIPESNNDENPVEGPSTLIIQMPTDTVLPAAPFVSWMGGGSMASLSDPSTNASAAFKLPFDSLRQLLSTLVN